MKKIFFLILFTANSLAFEGLSDVSAHPPYEENYTCNDHAFNPEAKEAFLKTGTDCIIVRMVEVSNKKFLKIYTRDGLENEDYYGWMQPVLSPCSCIVKKVVESNAVNTPGLSGNRDEVAYVSLITESGISFILAHLGEILIKEGQHLSRGQKIALVGNNGNSRAPHVHMVAWKDAEPLQIRFDPMMKRPTKTSQPDT